MSSVKDDLMNAWGRFLLPEDETSAAASVHSKTQRGLESLREEVNKACKPFKFVTATASGSKAVQWILSNQDDLNSVLIGSGCYVSGDDFHVYSKLRTGTINLHQFGEISTTHADDKAKKHTVPLPYHIPCNECSSTGKSDLDDLEKNCLEEIHLRCLQAILIGCPIKCLFLELMLQCNGAILTDDFLVKLAKLSQKHEFTIIVDEILTGGRCEKMLLTFSKPTIFQERVSYVCMGKWMGMGLVLCSKDLYSTVPQVGETTGTNYNEAVVSFKKVRPLLRNIPTTRQAVLNNIGSNEDNSWGVGILIWSQKVVTVPNMKNHLGVVGRYLPFIKHDAESFGNNYAFSVRYRVSTTEIPYKEEFVFNKANCSDHCMEGVEYWLDVSKEQGDKVTRKVSTFIHETAGTEFDGKKAMYDQYLDKFPASEGSKDSYKEVLAKAIKLGLICLKLTGTKRKKSYVAHDIACIEKCE